MSTEFITDIGNFDHINFNNTISGKTGVFNDSILIQGGEVATKSYVDEDISSLSVRDTGFYNQITGLLSEDTNIVEDISSLNVISTGNQTGINNLNLVVSSLHVRSSDNSTNINNLAVDQFFEQDTNQIPSPTKLFANSGVFNESLTVGGSAVLTEVTDGEIRWQDAPTTSTSVGLSGQVAYDSGYMYVCVTDNNWRRLAISDF